ncbi:UNVERIFIED_CONTAM: hypothetical protein Slati_0092800 [Sesamum latifolium]|uniref:DUF659 domain-containing protein n=1 Tax=Sesamum latifolium TaxID=2727402 RepID=A0AAW2Y9D7_9LAMI
MADGWTDRKHRSLINFLVNSPKGTKFIGSVDASSYSYTGEKLFELLDKFVQQIGEKNVNQFITDSTSANVLDDMVRPAKIRFATAFLTLKRFHTEKANLKKMFTSEKWTKSKANEAIAASFSNVEEKYQKEIDIIDARWDIQLHRPLHAAGYYLNHEFYYSNPSVEQDKEVMGGLFKCIERLIPNGDVQDKLIKELAFYKKAEGIFGIPMAIRQRSTGASDDIDESNEWLLGRLNLSEEDDNEETARVYEDDDLTWEDVA